MLRKFTLLNHSLSASIIGVLFLYSNLLNSQESINSRFNFDFLEYMIEDTYFTVGINRGGVFWSNHYSDLSDGNGFNFGIETYTPLMNKSFLNFGILFSQKRFSHLPKGFSENHRIEFQNNTLEFPLFASFELPVLREYDFRFNLGVQFNYRLSTNRVNEYQEEVTNSDVFFYPIDGRYKNFDGGMLFGLSAERNNFYFRLRSASGSNNFYSSEQGMLHAFYIDFGYFLFRKLRTNN